MAAWASRVATSNVLKVWPACVEFIQDAIDHADGEMLLEDVLECILAENWALWVVIDEREVMAAGVTEVAVYPRFRALRAIILGGKQMSKWLPTIDAAWERAAAQLGCERIEAAGRKGWTRATKPLGYRPGMQMIIKELSNG